jgi:hypothetical protein
MVYQLKFGGGVVISRKIAVVSFVCVLLAVTACRREHYYEPLKLGRPAAEQPVR